MRAPLREHLPVRGLRAEELGNKSDERLRSRQLEPRKHFGDRSVKVPVPGATRGEFIGPERQVVHPKRF